MLKKMGEFNLWVADAEGCRPGAAVICHAAKAPCHMKLLGYRGSLPKDHPEYLVARRGSQLYLNIVDAPIPIFRLEIFQAALDFIDEYRQEPTILHCNGGLSRAPSIALMWLTRRANVLCPWSYEDAKEMFTKVYFPEYQPGLGIQTFLTERWGEIR